MIEKLKNKISSETLVLWQQNMRADSLHFYIFAIPERDATVKIKYLERERNFNCFGVPILDTDEPCIPFGNFFFCPANGYIYLNNPAYNRGAVLCHFSDIFRAQGIKSPGKENFEEVLLKCLYTTSLKPCEELDFSGTGFYEELISRKYDNYIQAFWDYRTFNPDETAKKTVSKFKISDYSLPKEAAEKKVKAFWLWYFLAMAQDIDFQFRNSYASLEDAADYRNNIFSNEYRCSSYNNLTSFYSKEDIKNGLTDANRRVKEPSQYISGLIMDEDDFFTEYTDEMDLRYFMLYTDSKYLKRPTYQKSVIVDVGMASIADFKAMSVKMAMAYEYKKGLKFKGAEVDTDSFGTEIQPMFKTLPENSVVNSLSAGEIRQVRRILSKSTKEKDTKDSITFEINDIESLETSTAGLEHQNYTTAYSDSSRQIKKALSVFNKIFN